VVQVFPSTPEGEMSAGPDSLLTPRDVASRIHASTRTVYRLVKAGHLESVQVSPRGMRIRERSVDQLVEHGIYAPQLQEAS
jgi:excisionase family DNA binding protein